MSRIAKTPVLVPSGVDIRIDNGLVTAKGPRGEMAFQLSSGIEVVHDEGTLNVRLQKTEGRVSKQLLSMSGTTRAMLQNLVLGVTTGFEKKLTIKGVGYRAQVQGRNLNLNLGFSHPVVYELPEGITAATPTQTEITLSGTDKQAVGQAAADIRAFRPPEPYKGKGIRYLDEYVARKQARKK